ncbi:Sec-independent protein translocase protein TatB [Novosphingobium piscinae]|uniref:Sec-independent protein translocase protein TatB n=1 Tax=Novosphingobium piscinae TaxID=1507448 RepID=A0A7X1KP27_9SPHN|nr:Sec-independent protein translocase protein TatB [Novosphingobium piscinae]MBC2668306.1 twin-arginine translocase subunit TatB [Novosphingobium piscinae]
MFDIGADELLLTAVVAIVVIGPKDLPRAMRVAGKWVAKMRRMSNAFRSGFENMVREAELEEMEREWKERNAAIMAAHPTVVVDPDGDAAAAAAAAEGQPLAIEHWAAPAEPGAAAQDSVATASSAAPAPAVIPAEPTAREGA